jgi:hypothetical protein
MLKQVYPTASREVYEDPQTGWNYFTDGRSAWVKVGILIEDIECIDYLPIMDFRNNAIAIEKVTSTDVNKTIQRSTAKAIAMHGLGLALWTGEDVPELVVIKDKPTIEDLNVGDKNWDKVSKYVEGNKSLGVAKILNQLTRKYKISSTAKESISKIIKSK